jgi:hypothetical protein
MNKSIVMPDSTLASCSELDPDLSIFFGFQRIFLKA